jgi:hypothetical protein
VSIAEELRSAFARGNGEISVVQASKSTIEKRVRENAFDTRLGFISNVEVDPDMASMDLFGMDGGRAPRGGRSLSPMEAAQQLRLGIVGSLQPSGAQAPALQDAVSGGRITLESTQLLT